MIAILSNIISTFGLGMGALIRILPELVRLIWSIFKMRHEYKMASLTLETLKARLTHSDAAGKLMNTAAESSAATRKLELEIIKAQVEAQARPSGNRFIDAWNKAMRPFIISYVFFEYALYKTSIIIYAWTATVSWMQFSAYFWDSTDKDLLGTVVGYLFVNRVIHYAEKTDMFQSLMSKIQGKDELEKLLSK